MKNKFKIVFVSIFLMPAIVLNACKPQAAPAATPSIPATPATPAASPAPAATPSALSARLSEITGKVDIKQAGQNAFAPANADSFLDENGQVQTGDDGRVRLDLSTGTIIRVAPASLFTLISNEPSEESLKTRLELTLGQLFIILNGGSMEVQTPSGTAAVRGSYMSVSYDSNSGEVRITCLEGNCSLSSAGGSVEITAGQTAVVTGAGQPPQIGEMSDQDIQDWLNNNPEANLVVPTPTEVPVATEPPPAQVVPPVVPGPLVFVPPIKKKDPEPKEPPLPLTPTVVISSVAPLTSVVGGTVTLIISVLPSPDGPIPTGTVKVLANGIPICNVPLDAAGNAACVGGIPAAGSYNLVADYSGDGNYFVAQSTALGYTVIKASTTTTITSYTPASSVVGGPVTLIISVLPSPGAPIPTGTVKVLANGIPICTAALDATGNTTCIGGIPAAGSPNLVADYPGDGNYLAAQSTNLGYTVIKASTTTTITSFTPSPSIVGTSVLFTATVDNVPPGAGLPTGNVFFSDGVNNCTVTSAPWTCSITFTITGPRAVTASYSGDTNFNGSVSTSMPHAVLYGVDSEFFAVTGPTSGTLTNSSQCIQLYHVKVLDVDGVSDVKMEYSLNDNTFSSSPVQVLLTNTGPNTWQGSISVPAFALDIIFWRFIALDGSGNSTFYGGGGSTGYTNGYPGGSVSAYFFDLSSTFITPPCPQVP